MVEDLSGAALFFEEMSRIRSRPSSVKPVQSLTAEEGAVEDLADNLVSNLFLGVSSPQLAASDLIQSGSEPVYSQKS